MSRTTILALVAAVALVVGIPVGIAVLGGGDDGPDGAVPTAGEGLNHDNVPPEKAGDGQSPPIPQSRGAEKSGGKGGAGRGGNGGGPPQHATSFDERMAGVGYPNRITESASEAIVAVERAAGAEVEAGQQTVIAADCRDGVCSIRYRSGPRGTGMILDTQQRILRSLFADPKVKRVVLYVHHKTVGRKKEERPAFIVVTCSRTPGIVWSRVTARQIANHCKYTDNAGGKLRSALRRGQLSVDQASTGADLPPAGSGGEGGGRDAPPGAKPPGTPAPRKVKPERVERE